MTRRVPPPEAMILSSKRESSASAGPIAAPAVSNPCDSEAIKIYKRLCSSNKRIRCRRRRPRLRLGPSIVIAKTATTTRTPTIPPAHVNRGQTVSPPILPVDPSKIAPIRPPCGTKVMLFHLLAFVCVALNPCLSDTGALSTRNSPPTDLIPARLSLAHLNAQQFAQQQQQQQQYQHSPPTSSPSAQLRLVDNARSGRLRGDKYRQLLSEVSSMWDGSEDGRQQESATSHDEPQSSTETLTEPLDSAKSSDTSAELDETTQEQQQGQSHQEIKLPASANCLINAQMPTESTTSQNQSSSAKLPPIKMFKFSSELKSTSDSSGDELAPSSGYFYVPPANNSVRFLNSNQQQHHQQAADANEPNQMQVLAFDSLCGGWRNSLWPDRRKQPAYWVLDRRRGALVARFDFYTREEFFDLDGHEAKLTSPLFYPIPAYHFNPDSPYYSSCRMTFRSYLTVRAHLELSFLPTAIINAAASGAADSSSPPSQSSSEATTSIGTDGESFESPATETTIIKQQQQQQLLGESIALINIIDEKWSQRLADQEGEEAAWREHNVSLPTSQDKRTYFRLEFSAIPSPVRKDSIHQYGYLNGLAIANFSLTPQCFGLGVDPAELERTGEQVRPYTSLELLAGDDHSSTGDQETEQQQQLEQHQPQHLLDGGLKQLLEAHKMSILICVILVLVLVLVASQWILCTYFHTDPLLQEAPPPQQNGFGLAANSSGNNNSKANKTSDKLLNWCWCFCWCCCSRKLRDRRRVYQATRRQLNGQNLLKQEQINGKLAAANSQFARDQLRNSYLRPLSAAILSENVALLNVNPSYAPNGNNAAAAHNNNGINSATNMSYFDSPGGSSGSLSWQQKHLSWRNRQLEAYSIDRKRLTMTNLIGQGAFGEVYQGYLVCHYSDDGTKKITNDKHGVDDDSLESDSIKVAVKTCSGEKMSKRDFEKEANNFSQVSHRNIVQFIGVCFDKEPLLIIMEFMAGGNLKQFLLKNRDKVAYNAPAQFIRTSPTPSTSSATALRHLVTTSAAKQNNGRDNNNEPRVRLSMGDLLVFALDIARACDYLQERNFIHRDLAARNCLLTASVKQLQNHMMASNRNQQQQHQAYNLNSQHASSMSPLLPNIEQQQAGSSAATNGRSSSASMRTFKNAGPPSALEVDANYKVDLDQVYLNGYMNSSIVAKLADFGMTCDVSERDNYYRMANKELPVRWLPPECLDGIARTESDVWSFGVFLWELFSMGQLPYQHLLDNGQVIDLLRSRRHARSPCQQQQQQARNNNNNSDNQTSVTDSERPLLSAMSSDYQNQSAAPSPSGDPAAAVYQSPVEARSGRQSSSVTPLAKGPKIRVSDEQQQQQEQQEQEQQHQQYLLASDQIELPPPLPPPHDNTPHAIYSIMCSCWATDYQDRPPFKEIANRLYWCLQEPSIVNTSLPTFNEQRTVNKAKSVAAIDNAYNQHRQHHQQQDQQLHSNSADDNSGQAIYLEPLTVVHRPSSCKPKIEVPIVIASANDD